MPLQVAGQLRKMLHFWGERKVYDRDTLQQLESAVQSRDRDAQLQPPKVSRGFPSVARVTTWLPGLPQMLKSARGTLQHLDTAVQRANHGARLQPPQGCLPWPQACRITVLQCLPCTATLIPGFLDACPQHIHAGGTCG